MLRLTAGSGYLLGGRGRVTCSPGGPSWVSSRLQGHLKGAGEEAESPSADTSVEKAVNLSCFLIATEEMVSGKPDSQLAPDKIATQIYATSSGFSK